MKSPYCFSELKEPSKDILSQEVVTYMRRDGYLVKVTVKRNFFADDYVDSSKTEVITKLDI